MGVVGLALFDALSGLVCGLWRVPAAAAWKHLVHLLHAFWFLSDDRSPRSHGSAGALRAVSTGLVRPLGPSRIEQFGAPSRVEAGRPEPLTVRAQPAVSAHSGLAVCRNHAALAPGSARHDSKFSRNFAGRLNSLPAAGKATGGVFCIFLEYQSCE